MDSEEMFKLSFIGEWFQEEAGMERKFIIFYYTNENSIELYDIKSRKTFLKRIKMKDIIKTDFYIGAKLDIFGRQIEILDYADNATRMRLAATRERTFVIIHGNLVHQIGDIISVLNDNGISLNNARMVRFPIQYVKKFFGESNKSDANMTVLITNLVHGHCVGLELMGPDVLERIKKCLAQDESSKGVDVALRTYFEDEEMRSNIYCSKSEENCKKEVADFFDYKNELITTVLLKNTTSVVIKPHAIKEGKAGPIIKEICQNGFRITGLKMLKLERVNSEEFYEIYRGLLPDYAQMVSQLSSGMCMALELESVDPKRDAHAEFRKLCGPIDPEICRHLRPNTLRAKYGKNKVLNALHCTDLPEDCVLETEYFFKILE